MGLHKMLGRPWMLRGSCRWWNNIRLLLGPPAWAASAGNTTISRSPRRALPSLYQTVAECPTCSVELGPCHPYSLGSAPTQHLTMRVILSALETDITSYGTVTQFGQYPSCTCLAGEKEMEAGDPSTPIICRGSNEGSLLKHARPR